jgi:hypothetical protein
MKKEDGWQSTIKPGHRPQRRLLEKKKSPIVDRRFF